MDEALVIEAGTESPLVLAIEASPELVFEETGLQGIPGPPAQVESGDAIRVVGEVVHVDISRLTFAP